MIWVMKATLYFRGHGTSLDITDTPTINKIISRHDKKINYGQDLKTSSLLPPLVINRSSERKNWSNVQQSIEFKCCWSFQPLTGFENLLAFGCLWKPWDSSGNLLSLRLASHVARVDAPKCTNVWCGNVHLFVCYSPNSITPSHSPARLKITRRK